jgi:hypothetical protein
LVSHFENFPPHAQTRMLVGLNAFGQTLSDSDIRRRIAEKLREKVYRHREFPDAPWVLSKEAVDELEKAQRQFEPEDLMARHAWLFARFPRFSPTLSWEERELEVSAARREALTEILAKDGASCLFNLAKSVEAPDAVGDVLGRFDLLFDESVIIPGYLDSENGTVLMLATGYVMGRFSQEKWGWVTGLNVARWPCVQAVTLALCLPFDRATWNFVSELGEEIERSYWTRAVGGGHGLGKTDLEYVISQYNRYQRHFQAVNVIVTGLFAKYEFEPDLMFDTLEAGLTPRG